jgi:hypothetical protein
MSAPIEKVFISHSNADKPFVDRLVTDLAARVIPAWQDRLDMTVGDGVAGSISEGLAGARYFLIVLSQSSIGSRWVQEDVNGALMQQAAESGTFLVPVLLQDCDVPPVLQQRRYADFRSDYNRGLGDLLEVWDKDRAAALLVNGKPLYPWPDLAAADEEFVYLHSSRFDKFFRMACNLSTTTSLTIDYIVETLKLPWSQEVAQFGMKWCFSYWLTFGEKDIGLSTTLRDAGVEVGSVLDMGISGTYADAWERELEELMERFRVRGVLTPERLRELGNACFAHM